jgi:hypothetical protein
MRGVTVAAVLIAAAAMPATVGARLMSGHPLGGPGLVGPKPTAVAVQPSRAGAKHVQLTVKLWQELACGHLRGNTVVVALPGFSLPQQIAPDAVRVGTETPQAVSVSRSSHTVRITLQPQHGITCHSIVLAGRTTVVFERTANLANPKRAGAYRVSVTAGHQKTSASVSIG